MSRSVPEKQKKDWITFVERDNLFILAGNGPYDNRGCEAIVRGTAEIIRQHFDAPRFLAVSNFQNEEQFNRQLTNESDPGINHQKMLCAKKRFTAGWLLNGLARRIAPYLWGRGICKRALTCLKDAKAVLVLGGDTYSLDYERPVLLTCLDNFVLQNKKPLIIWGASVGPFGRFPEYEKYMIKHLTGVTGVFVRESESLAYLADKGIKENVRLVADPAFLLEAIEPVLEQKIVGDSIGINLSPLMAQYVTGGNYNKWVTLAAKIVREISIGTQRKIYLIPHVTSPHTNDHAFLKDISTLLEGTDVVLIPDKYNAAETKWIISKMTIFVGARTHSTIAAMSRGVPTLSLAYSIKAAGINKDVFGHEDYCLEPQDLHPINVVEKIKELICERTQIQTRLAVKASQMKDLSLRAGAYLKELV